MSQRTGDSVVEPTAALGSVILHVSLQGGEFVGQWPHHSPVKSMPQKGGPTVCITPYAIVAAPTVAIRVPSTEAPNERKDKVEVLGGNPLPEATTCAADTPSILAGSDTLGAPLAGVVTSSLDAAAT